MGDLRVEELSAKTIVAANGLTLRPGQEQYVTPVSYSANDAYLNPTTTWARVVLDGEEVVGFVRGNFDPDNPREEFRSCVWRINVDAGAQGRGVGRRLGAGPLVGPPAQGHQRQQDHHGQRHHRQHQGHRLAPLPHRSGLGHRSPPSTGAWAPRSRRGKQPPP